MSSAAELHIIAPGICGPLAETRSLATDEVVVDWSKRLSKTDCQSSAASKEGVITQLFGLQTETDFPTAMFELLATQDIEPGLTYMCADPVHLQADMDHAVLTSCEDLSLTDDESAELCTLLDEHFSQDGIRFLRRSKNRWMVSSTADISMSTTPLCEAVGRNINFLLPQGESSTYWKQVLTEAQMLLFSHEINTRRESQGRVSINSLWLYGSGSLPNVSAGDIDTVTANDDMLKGVARHARCVYLQLPDSAAEYMKNLLESDAQRHVLYLPDLEHLTNYRDVSLWSNQLGELLKHWLYPLMQLSNKNGLTIFLYACTGKRYRFSKYDDLNFWRRGKL